jgi:hypothetical protein
VRTLMAMAAVLLLAACSREDPALPTAQAPAGGDSPLPPAAEFAVRPSLEEEVVATGEAAATALTQELIGRVMAAMQESGPADAIDFCSEEALPRTSAVADELGVVIKRTSLRVRNPENAPDADERAALEHFASALEAGDGLPANFVQEAEDGTRYYRPIVIADVCTACHGPRETLDPAVVDVLDMRYPDDQATGYQAGDFRGLVRVTMGAER